MTYLKIERIAGDSEIRAAKVGQHINGSRKQTSFDQNTTKNEEALHLEGKNR